MLLGDTHIYTHIYVYTYICNAFRTTCLKSCFVTWIINCFHCSTCLANLGKASYMVCQYVAVLSILKLLMSFLHWIHEKVWRLIFGGPQEEIQVGNIMSFFVTLRLSRQPPVCWHLRCVHVGHSGRMAGEPAEAAKRLWELSSSLLEGMDVAAEAAWSQRVNTE